MRRLNVKGFSLAFGVITALWLFGIALISSFTGWGADIIALYHDLFLGYEATILGSFIGAIWGFAYGYLFGFLIAFFYNLFIR